MALLFLLGAAVAAMMVVGLLAVLGTILKLLFWIVLLPLRLVAGLLIGLFGLLVSLVAAPFVALAVGAGVFIALAVLLVPMLPVLLLAIIGWAIYKATSRRPAPVI